MAFQQSGCFRSLLRRLGRRAACPAAFKQAARRVFLQSRLASPRRGFFVIVPLEYKSMGRPVPSWHIDALMRFHNRPYSDGLLSAAAFHGATHQQPLGFKIVTDAALRPAVAGRTRLRFLYKKRLAQTPTMRMKTEIGSLVVGTSPLRKPLPSISFAAPRPRRDLHRRHCLY